MQPDEELVRLAKQAVEGDTRAFEELVLRYQSSVLANCRHLTRSRDDAEDLAQDVFVKAFFRLESFEGRSSFRSWVQSIKVNHCLNYLKARRRRPQVDIDEAGLEFEPSLVVTAGPEAALESNEERALIRQVLDSLPDSLRVPLVLCDVDGLSYRTIEETLKLGPSATKMRIARAREEFRRRYRAAQQAPAGANASGTTA
jgi:RNA polymerase sigma-70 factor (ECF subfamily)